MSGPYPGRAGAGVASVSNRHPAGLSRVDLDRLHDGGAAVDVRPAEERRRTPADGARGPWTALRAALYRQSADDDRAACWVRDVRLVSR